MENKRAKDDKRLELWCNIFRYHFQMFSSFEMYITLLGTFLLACSIQIVSSHHKTHRLSIDIIFVMYLANFGLENVRN